ncbi:MAG: histone deacetylase [archaeon]
MQIVFDKKILDYKGTLGNPRRMIPAYEFLKDKYNFVKPEISVKEPIVHSKKLIDNVKTGDFYDLDSPPRPGIYDLAMLALNSAITSQDIQGFSFMEPPGHHAGKDYLGGFCYFNNIAEAVERSKLKTLIIDIDGHHGNGTEDIFKGRKDIRFVSLHCSPCYPGTGRKSKKNIFNYPLNPRCGEEKYLETFDKALEEATKNFEFEQIAVSAGFDAYKGDHLGVFLGLEKETYYKIGKIIKELTEKNKARKFAVLEGGYSRDFGELIDEFVKGMS